ncbi:uncharacterized protein MELLADRAFT_107664 [Melampsora larici-populina 98AG31]|uniref:Uncharacterized protein n=1 Tax=Melampsora larici-populina (strain 98AG31 / pathotype 3-4-7) TaxID=747676 RepID=F4RQC9_MELLP|nr:uncharacterized protein MELLADRAFT_107664 [Melampsora larici-populina 98AG31]EGG05385.1 hypothetical protein MELLADRAFT_107664 [Melampsora larici-populina 98AG31]
MSFTNLGLNLAALSSVDTWFHLKRVILQSARNTKSSEDVLIRQSDNIPSYPFKLFPSDKLLTWTPQTVVEITFSDDQLSSGTVNSEENYDTAFNSLNREHGTIAIELLTSPASSVSLESLSCYSSDSQEEINNESESSFDSLFEDDSIENSSIYQNVNSVRTPNPTDTVLAEEKALLEPISLENQSWNERINYLATDEEWDDHIDKLAKEFEKEMGFDSETETECLSFDNNMTRISAAFDCDKEEVEDGEFEDIFLSPECSEGEEVNRSFDSLFDGEDSMMDEFEDSVESQETSQEFNNIFKISEEEKQEYQLLSLQRHARAIRRNPHLFHLFR